MRGLWGVDRGRTYYSCQLGSPILVKPTHLLQQRKGPPSAQEIVDHHKAVSSQIAAACGSQLFPEPMKATIKRLRVLFVELLLLSIHVPSISSLAVT